MYRGGLETRAATYKFQVTNVGAEVEFVRDDKGKMAKALIRISGQQIEAKKVQ